MSDIFGAAVEASVTGVTPNTWLVGEDVFTPGIAGDALRFMNNPTQAGSGNRDYYPDLLATDDVHFGSGIGNLAFYLLTSGGSHPRGKTSVVVTGIGISKSARIFYLALRDYLLSSSNYSAARDTTARVAAEWYGNGAAEYSNTCKAWDAVAVPNSGLVCYPVPSAPASITLPNTSASGSFTVSWGVASGSIREYSLYESSSSTFATQYLAYRGTARSITLAGRESGTYFYRVSACNYAGCSNPTTAPNSLFVDIAIGTFKLISTSYGGMGPPPPFGQYANATIKNIGRTALTSIHISCQPPSQTAGPGGGPTALSPGASAVFRCISGFSQPTTTMTLAVPGAATNSPFTFTF